MVGIRGAYMVSKLDLYKVFCKVGKSDSFSMAAKELYDTTTVVKRLCD